jgi:hypothetical protein
LSALYLIGLACVSLLVISVAKFRAAVRFQQKGKINSKARGGCVGCVGCGGCATVMLMPLLLVLLDWSASVSPFSFYRGATTAPATGAAVDAGDWFIREATFSRVLGVP